MIEIHPWKKFPEKNNKANKLILGSFPPNKFTVQTQKKTQCDMGFFYGSKDNFFWQLFSDALGLKYKFPDDLNNLKKYLVENNWIVSDVVLQCTRKNNTASDQDLKVSTWNQSIINEIIDNNPIQTIYFTSRWVKEKFDRHININTSATITKQYILPSPSRNGLRSIGRAAFLEYQKEPNETATDFRLRYYKDILNR
jgi:G:T/U-mismatch repair DNA glycosylase